MSYALRTAPHREERAVEIIEARGHVATVPTQLKLFRRRHRKPSKSAVEVRAEKIAPGYVIASTPCGRIDDQWGDPIITRTIGRVTPAELDRLAALAREQPQIESQQRTFAAGQQITLTSGPFKGLTATYVQPMGRMHQISMPWFGRAHRKLLVSGFVLPK